MTMIGAWKLNPAKLSPGGHLWMPGPQDIKILGLQGFNKEIHVFFSFEGEAVCVREYQMLVFGQGAKFQTFSAPYVGHAMFPTSTGETLSFFVYRGPSRSLLRAVES